MAKVFFPPLKTLCKALKLHESDFINPEAESKEVTISIKLLKALLVSALSDLQLDVQRYAETNPDVANAFATFGEYAEHFRKAGYFEGRSVPVLFDPEFYVLRYPDVAVAVKLHGLDPHDHFEKAGIYENRIPHPRAEEEVAYWTAKISNC